MTTKEKVKDEIDNMPEELLDQVYEFINALKIKKARNKKIHTYRLKGRFDNMNIRERAYEKDSD
ncbi:hypothetical protein GF406_04810 [candidate division KSB1 bacterium]|nr:hypothetical protein [candidate division KSB1 bacterium]